MTTVQYVENLIRDNWQSAITGRPHNVGVIDKDIKIVYESDDEWSQMNLGKYDYITLQDGGLVNMEAKSFGWSEEDIVSRVSVDLRTRGWPQEGRPGRIALYGERGAGALLPNEAPRWGGLVGETLRVLKSVRGGDEEFCIIDTNEADDLSGQMGGQIWRSVVNVRLESRSSTIDTSI